MIYRTAFDLVKALASTDPNLIIASDGRDMPYGFVMNVTSDFLPAASKQLEMAEAAISDAVRENLIGCRPLLSTANFRFRDFRIVHGSLEAEAYWDISSYDSFLSAVGGDDYDVLMGETDVWGADIAIAGMGDFETVRDDLSTWGYASFNLTIDEQGWQRDDVELTADDPEEVAPATRSLIERNLSALNAALKARYKKLALGLSDQIISNDTRKFTLNWSSSESSEYGITVIDGISGILVNRADESFFKYLLDYKCECDVLLP